MGTPPESDDPGRVKSAILPKGHKEEPAATFTLEENDNRISSDCGSSYSISRSFRAIQQKQPSIQLERIDTGVPQKPDSGSSPIVFYLVHPMHAQYRDDKPAYYATCDGLGFGNIVLEIEKKILSRAEYKVLLHHGTTSASQPLFLGNPETIFTAKGGRLGGEQSWINSSGETIAQEKQGRRREPQLEITKSLKAELRDTLVAAWCLKLWSEVAESRESKKDGIERLTPPEAIPRTHTKLYKRTQALGGFAGAAGGG